MEVLLLFIVHAPCLLCQALMLAMHHTGRATVLDTSGFETQMLRTDNTANILLPASCD